MQEATYSSLQGAAEDSEDALDHLVETTCAQHHFKLFQHRVLCRHGVSSPACERSMQISPGLGRVL